MDRKRKILFALQHLGVHGSDREDALSTLSQDARTRLIPYLVSRGVSYDDAEDCLQAFFLKLVLSAKALCFDKSEAWDGYLYKSGWNCYLDIQRKKKGVDYLGDLPDQEATTEDDFADDEDSQKLYSLANDLWLTTAPEDAELRLLAGKMFFLDKRSLGDIVEFLNCQRGASDPIACEVVLSWFNCVWLIRRIAYDRTYIPQMRLTAWLLGGDCTYCEDVSRVVDRYGTRSGNWSRTESDYIRLRFGYGLRRERILEKLNNLISGEEAERIERACISRFPFVSSLRSVWESFEEHSLRHQALTKNPYWKRLVLQFFFADDLTQEEVLQRVSPMAPVVGYALNHINSWTASRLRNELTEFWRTQNGENTGATN